MGKQSSKNAKKRHIANNELRERARQNGVKAVRRNVSPESRSLLNDIEHRLEPELVNVARLFLPTMLHVTIIGYSRYSPVHRSSMLQTADVADSVPHSQEKIENVRLGRLGIYGGGSHRAPKLAIGLTSEEIATEIAQFESRFASLGFPLMPEFNREEEVRDGYLDYDAHLSIAYVDSDRQKYLTDPRLLKKLSLLAELMRCEPSYITLDPVVLARC